MTHPDDPTSEYVREVDDLAEAPDPDIEAGPPETEGDLTEAQRIEAQRQAFIAQHGYDEWDLRGAD